MFRKEKGFIPHLKKGAGFTLIELLIVIAVIGILAAAILPRFISFDSDARIAADQGSLSSMRAALVLYRAKFGEYPVLFAPIISGGTYGLFMDKIPVLQVTTWSGQSTAVGITVADDTGWILLTDNQQIYINRTTATTW